MPIHDPSIDHAPAAPEPVTAPASPVPSGRFRKIVGKRLGAFPAEDKWARLREIESLDPVEDCVRIYWLFMEDFQAATRFRMVAGLLVTSAPPRMSRILDQSGELHKNVLKRITDTYLLDSAYHEHGFGPGPGREAARRMNEMHRKYDIHSDDFVYIGCHEAVAAVWYAETYGWRPVTGKEKVAAAEFAKLRGRHMWQNGNTPYPETFEEMEKYCAWWEEEQFRYEPQNRKLADALVDYALNGVPGFLRPAMRAFFFSVGPDPRVVTSCGYEMPSRFAQKLSRAVMRFYGRLDPLVTGPSPMARSLVNAVYPNGFEIKDLGTHLKHD